jgi:tetratricopeptide (TPR) repeat protein
MNTVISKFVAAIGITFLITTVSFCVVGSPTTPPSAGQSGLTPNPNSTGINTGNAIVSGNVGGGREFRGFVPYGSSGYFQGSQGTGTGAMESFIRRSTGSPYATDRSPGAVQPYYSPYRSVSSLASRGAGGYQSSSALELPQMSPLKKPNEFGLVPLEEARKLLQKNEPVPSETVETFEQQPPVSIYGNYRPLSSTPFEMEPYIAEQIKSKLNPTEQKAQANAKQQSSLENISPATKVNDYVFEPVVKPEQPGEPAQLPEPGQLSAKARNEIAKSPSVFDKMQQTIRDEFEKNLKQTASTKKDLTSDANQLSDVNAPEAAPAISPVMAKAIAGYSTTFATKATDRFNELMMAAEEYIKQKQYYKAADAYSLAAIYQPNNPLPYAGKAHALFGAGEYMSSAYFLSRAIEIFPDYPRFPIDPNAMSTMFGDKDLLEKRTVDIKDWQDKTGSPELQFLLAYIYFQNDQLELAQRMTNGALAKMSQWRALKILDKVIRLRIEEANKTGQP